MSNTSNYIESLIKETESQLLVFSAGIDHEQIGKTVCSFLNAKGGKLILGVDHDKKITGIKDAKNKVTVLNKVLINEIIPSPAVNVDIESYKQKDILIVSVWEGAKQPYIFHGSVFYRIGNNVEKATSAQLAELIHSQEQKDERWELKPAIEAEIDDIDLHEVQTCIKEIEKADRIKDVSKEPLLFLSKFGLYQNGDFTNAAVVLFGKESVKFFPQCSVRLSVFSSDKAGEHIVYDKFFDKNLFQSVNQITEFFDLAYGVSSSFVSTDWKRVDHPKYPRHAIREAILNAFIHRDYSSYSAGFTINIYPNKLVISNNGKLPNGITVDDLAKDHLSQPFNPNIAKICFLRLWIEKIGRGTIKMIQQCNDLGFKTPVWTATTSTITITFPDLSIPFNYSEGISEGISEGLNKLIAKSSNEGISEGLSEGLKDSLLEIIHLLIKHKSLRISELSVKLNKPQKTLERHVSILKEIGAIKYLGSKRTGGYSVTKDLLKKTSK